MTIHWPAGLSEETSTGRICLRLICQGRKHSNFEPINFEPINSLIEEADVESTLRLNGLIIRYEKKQTDGTGIARLSGIKEAAFRCPQKKLNQAGYPTQSGYTAPGGLQRATKGERR